MRFSKVVLITVDCLRASAIHCLGSPNRTENIDRLAKDGILFRQAVANGPGTPQSFPSIFTSTYPLMHQRIIPSPKYATLAEVLTRNGFTCAGFHSNPFLSRLFKWNRGFETFQDSTESIQPTSNLILRYPPRIRSAISKMVSKVEEHEIIERLLINISHFRSKTTSQPPYLTGEETNRVIFEWLKKHDPEKFFLWIHYMDPHSPYSPPFLITKIPSAQKKKKNKTKMLYNLEVEYVDLCIGELIRNLEELKLLTDSIVVLTSDHGEGFGEHNIFQHFKHALYEELIHVPLIIQGLDQREAIDTPVSLVDLVPTILDLLKAKEPKALCGKSLVPLIEEGTAHKQDIFSESARFNLKDFAYDFSRTIYSHRGERWKLILDNIKGSKELYDLLKDPHEQENKANSEEELTKILTKKIAKHSQWERRMRGT